MQFIDSSTFMASSLSNLVDNLAEGIHKLKQKHGYDDKKKKNGKRVELSTKIMSAFWNA